MMRRMLYSLAFTTGQIQLYFLNYSLSHWQRWWQDLNPWLLDDKASVLPMHYQHWPNANLHLSYFPIWYKLKRLDSKPQPQDDEANVVQPCFYHRPNTTILFKLFSLPLTVAMAKLEPLTLGWQGKCFTNALPPLAICYFTFLLFSYLLQAKTSIWWRRWAFYILAYDSSQNTTLPFSLFFPHWQGWWRDLNTWFLDDKARVLPMYYHHLPNANLHLSYFPIWYKLKRLDSKPQPWDNEVSVLQPCFCHGPNTNIPFLLISLPLSAVVARFEPLTLGWWGKCFYQCTTTTHQMPIYIFAIILSGTS